MASISTPSDDGSSLVQPTLLTWAPSGSLATQSGGGKAATEPVTSCPSACSGASALPTEGLEAEGWLGVEIWGRIPALSPSCSFYPLGSTPPLTHLAPCGSDSAAPPGVISPASAPAKGGTWLSIVAHPPLLVSSPKVHSTSPLLWAPPDSYSQGTRGRKQ